MSPGIQAEAVKFDGVVTQREAIASTLLIPANTFF
jgi:hypothetical protein